MSAKRKTNQERKTREGMKVIHIPKRMWQQIDRIKKWLDRDLTTASVMLDCMDIGINWYEKKMAKAAKPQPTEAETVPNVPQKNNTIPVPTDEEFDAMLHDLYKEK